MVWRRRNRCVGYSMLYAFYEEFYRYCDMRWYAAYYFYSRCILTTMDICQHRKHEGNIKNARGNNSLIYVHYDLHIIPECSQKEKFRTGHHKWQKQQIVVAAAALPSATACSHSISSRKSKATPACFHPENNKENKNARVGSCSWRTYHAHTATHIADIVDERAMQNTCTSIENASSVRRIENEIRYIFAFEAVLLLVQPKYSQ